MKFRVVIENDMGFEVFLYREILYLGGFDKHTFIMVF